MTYNVFGGMLSLTQSTNQSPHSCKCSKVLRLYCSIFQVLEKHLYLLLIVLESGDYVT